MPLVTPPCGLCSVATGGCGDDRGGDGGGNNVAVNRGGGAWRMACST